MLRGKGLHAPEFAYDIARIPSLIIYTDLIEYIFVGNTKAPFLRWLFLFRSYRLETLYLMDSTWIIKSMVTMNYQIYGDLQFRPLLKKYFQKIHIDFGDASGEKNMLCVCRYLLSCFDV